MPRFMRVGAFALASLGCAVSILSADWGPPDFAAVATDSDLIVVGELSQASLRVDGRTSYGDGTIDVKQVLLNRSGLSFPLHLRWQNSIYIACPRMDPELRIGWRQVWLLKVDANGNVSASRPDRIIALDDSFVWVVEQLRSKVAPEDSDSPKAILLAFLEGELRAWQERKGPVPREANK